MLVPARMETLETRKQGARDWFESLSGRIIAAFEALEDAAPGELYRGAAGRFVRTPWLRKDGANLPAYWPRKFPGR